MGAQFRNVHMVQRWMSFMLGYAELPRYVGWIQEEGVGLDHLYYGLLPNGSFVWLNWGDGLTLDSNFKTVGQKTEPLLPDLTDDRAVDEFILMAKQHNSAAWRGGIMGASSGTYGGEKQSYYAVNDKKRKFITAFKYKEFNPKLQLFGLSLYNVDHDSEFPETIVFVASDPVITEMKSIGSVIERWNVSPREIHPDFQIASRAAQRLTEVDNNVFVVKTSVDKVGTKYFHKFGRCSHDGKWSWLNLEVPTGV